MADQVEEVKRKTDIVEVVAERVKLARAGRNFKGLCPFHSEKTPSFFVSPELQIYRCFGCGKGGDVIAFLEEFEGMEFPEALEYLAGKAGVRLVRRARAGEERGEKERLVEINHLAAEFYHYLLTEHKVGEAAREYLKNRRMSGEAVRVFKLGYAPASWEGLQKFLVGKKGYRVEELERVGLVVKSAKRKEKSAKDYFYDRFRGRVVFPLTDGRGEVVGFACRLLDAEVTEAEYINTPETVLYHKSELLYGLSVNRGAIRKEGVAVVVEGEMDAIASWQAGVKNVVAIKGSAFTEEQIRLMLRYTNQVKLALDADAAGQEATRRSISLADGLGLVVRVIVMAGGKDPDEVVRNSPRAWREAVEKAVSVYDFYLKSAWSRFEIKTGEGKRKASGDLAPILAGMSNQVEQAHYIKKVAEKLGVSEEAVVAEVRKAGLGKTAQVAEVAKVEQEGKSRRERLEEYWLSLVLKVNQAERLVAIKEGGEEWESMAVKRVVGWWKEKPERLGLAVNELVSQLPAELKEVVERVWLREEEWGEGGVGELKGVKRELERLGIQGKLRVLGGQIGNLNL